MFVVVNTIRLQARWPDVLALIVTSAMRNHRGATPLSSYGCASGGLASSLDGRKSRAFHFFTAPSRVKSTAR
jgi:hypothetical protein